MHSTSDVTVSRADAATAERVAPLFARYREFYGLAYDERAALDFLRDRLERDQSVVLLAEQAGEAVGFTQLYPGFSSVRVAPVWVLNDLYVLESARGGGAADALMEEAERLARAAGAVQLQLETATDNLRAQRLYDKQGYTVESGYLHYAKSLI